MDSTDCLNILKKTNEFLSLDDCNFIAEKVYDVGKIYKKIKDQYNGNCFIPLNFRNSKQLKKLFCGNPICEAGLAMHKDGKTTDVKGGLEQKFSCPFKRKKGAICPCNHKNLKNTVKVTGCTKYVSLSSDYRLRFDINSIAFKSIYSLRTEAERYNSRFKQTGCERVFVGNSNSVKNFNTLAHISLLTIAIITASLGKSVSHSAFKSVKRLA